MPSVGTKKIYKGSLYLVMRRLMLILLALYYLGWSGVNAFPIQLKSLSGIVWSCLTTIFLCTWVAIHPNIPYPIHQESMGFWQKRSHEMRYTFTQGLPLFILALIFPEYILGWAIKQRMVADRIVNDAREKYSLNLTRTHGFFIIMGGFHCFKRSDEKDGPDVPCHPLHEITVLGLLKSNEIERPTEEEIQDRSKSDALAKAFVLVQTGWFILQCIARWTERIPTTQLEITTLAYTAMNFGIWLAWWDKPRNVTRPIRVKTHTCNHIPVQWRPLKFSRVILGMFYEGSIGRDELEQMKQVYHLYGGDAKRREIIYSDVIATAMGIIFGAIHCIAWPFEFPSRVESILWRISSISIAGLVALLFIFFCLGLAVGFEKKVIVGFFLPWVTLYMVGRIVQLVLTLTTLRSLPPEAYREVQWTNFIPHISA